MTNDEGKIYLDGCFIDQFYSLNRFYCGSVQGGSADFAMEPLLERPVLVATSVTESASNDFQRSVLFMSNHVDASHELVQTLQLDEFDNVDSPSEPIQDQKRRMETQQYFVLRKERRDMRHSCTLIIACIHSTSLG